MSVWANVQNIVESELSKIILEIWTKVDIGITHEDVVKLLHATHSSENRYKYCWYINAEFETDTITPDGTGTPTPTMKSNDDDSDDDSNPSDAPNNKLDDDWESIDEPVNQQNQTLNMNQTKSCNLITLGIKSCLMTLQVMPPCSQRLTLVQK